MYNIIWEKKTLLCQLDYYLKSFINYNHNNNAIFPLYDSMKIKKCFYHISFL